MACLAAHIGAENAHDLNAIMQTYAPGAVVEVNGNRFETQGQIRRLHESLGFAGAGIFADLMTRADRRFPIGDTIIVEGALVGVHVGEFGGRPATGNELTVPFCAVYQFDGNAKLCSERVYLDIAGAVNPDR